MCVNRSWIDNFILCGVLEFLVFIGFFIVLVIFNIFHNFSLVLHLKSRHCFILTIFKGLTRFYFLADNPSYSWDATQSCLFPPIIIGEFLDVLVSFLLNLFFKHSPCIFWNPLTIFFILIVLDNWFLWVLCRNDFFRVRRKCRRTYPNFRLHGGLQALRKQRNFSFQATKTLFSF